MAGVSGGRQRTRTNCRGVPSAGLSCVADVSGCPRTVTDRSGQYMPADRPSSLTDLVATGGAKPLKQRKRPESYSKPAQESSEASYSSSIWLYSTRTERGERNGRFCMASSICLPEGQRVNDLVTKVKLRRKRSARVWSTPSVGKPVMGRLTGTWAVKRARRRG